MLSPLPAARQSEPVRNAHPINHSPISFAVQEMPGAVAPRIRPSDVASLSFTLGERTPDRIETIDGRNIYGGRVRTPAAASGSNFSCRYGSASMTDFCIQIHTDRAPGIDLAAVHAACAALARDKALVRCFAVIEKGCVGHINLMFATTQPKALWEALQKTLFDGSALGDAIRRSSMVMCEGERSWDDYRLLHHFDPAERLDPLPRG